MLSVFDAQPAAANHLQKLIAADIIPAYFSEIPGVLENLAISDAGSSTSESIPVLIGGGTDLFVQKWDTIGEMNISLLNKKMGPNDISVAVDCLHIPATTTISTLSESKLVRKYFPEIQTILPLFGSLPIRNRATVAGNIVNASPIADFVNIAIALRASITLRNGLGVTRTVLLDKFYLGYKSLDKSPDEIITEVLIPLPKKNHLFTYEKISKRTYLDIASVNTSLSIAYDKGTIVSARISAGGVGPVPMLLGTASEYLAGKSVTIDVVKEAIRIAQNEISPISDARGSAVYKKLLLGQLIKAHFLKLFPELLSVEEILQ